MLRPIARLRLFGLSLACLLAFVGLAVAAAAQTYVDSLSAAVQREVVYVHAGAQKRLTPDEVGRLRLRILDRDLGRIKIAVVPPEVTRRHGGVAQLSNETAARLDARGALLVLAGSDAWVTTTYEPDDALAVVRRALNGEGDTAAALLRAVDGIARVDPGPSGDLAESASPTGGLSGPSSGDGGIGEFVDDIGNAIKLVVFGIGGLIALSVLIPVVLMIRRARRAHAEVTEDLEVARASARDELLAVGELLTELDLPSSLPLADQAGRDALGRAIEFYDKADDQLTQADTTRRLQRALATLARARKEAELARERLSSGPSAHAALPSES